MRRLILFLIATICCFSAPPVIFYTDITSGPKVGGPSNNGTILTICGKNFGATRGSSTVTIGGGAVASYLYWGTGATAPCGGAGSARGLETVSVQIGSSAVTGAVVVTVNSVTSNTDKTFTVTTWSSTNDRIFCEDSVSGSDSNNGQCAGDTQTLAGTPGPWQTIRHVKGILNTGDIVYFGASGVDYTSETDADLCYAATFAFMTGCFGGGTRIAHNGIAGHPVSLIGYPGQTAQIGCPTTACPPIVFGSTTTAAQYWNIINLVEIPGQCTVASGHCTSTPVNGGALGGLRIGGAGGTVKDGPGNVRIVNNKSTCPNGNTPNSGCDASTFNSTTNTPGTVTLFILGNHLVNYTDFTTDTTVGWGHNQAIYLGFDTDEVEVAWNDIDGSAGYSGQGMHIHSSAIGSTGGFPLYGIHIHDNYIHDTPAGNDMSNYDPSKGSGVEFYNNLFVHQGDCLDFPGSNTGWPQGYRRMGMISLGQPQWDENWAAMHGTVNWYNNTFVDSGHCAGELDGWMSVIAGSGSSASVKPPPDVTICPSSCSTTQSGTLPAASPTYAADNVGFEVKLGSTFITSLYDDGAGNLLETGTTVGTFNYSTGAYSFTLTEGSLNSTDVIKYRTIYGFKMKFQNNIIWQRSSSPAPYIGSVVSTPILYPKIIGDHNLFFTTGGQTPPSMFTSNVGSNSDPLFVANGTIGNIPANGDFHIQNTSPAKAAGETGLFPVKDFDGAVRSSPPSVGAFEVAAPASCSIQTTNLPNATTGVAYSTTVATSSCTSPSFSISAGSLPAWATLHSTTGVIDGTPSGSTPTTSNFTVAVTDANGNPTQALSILDITPPTITTTSPLTNGTQNVAYGPLQFTATGDTSGNCTGCAWSATGVPAGMTFSAGGSLGGTPTGVGTSTINVTVTNNSGAGSASGPFSLTINAPVTLTCPTGTFCVSGQVVINGSVR